jgi:hypothetical protein
VGPNANGQAVETELPGVTAEVVELRLNNTVLHSHPFDSTNSGRDIYETNFITVELNGLIL